MTHAAPLVVVGGGIAGLCTALATAPRPVLLLGRGERSEDTASTMAQGGIAAALGPADSIGAHVADTLLAGAFRNDGALVRAHNDATGILMASNSDLQRRLWATEPGKPRLLYIRPAVERHATFRVDRAEAYAAEGYRATKEALR